jgi:hypothetical protein
VGENARKRGRAGDREGERVRDTEREKESARARSTGDRGFDCSIRRNEGVRAPLCRQLKRRSSTKRSEAHRQALLKRNGNKVVKLKLLRER